MCLRNLPLSKREKKILHFGFEFTPDDDEVDEPPASPKQRPYIRAPLPATDGLDGETVRVSSMSVFDTASSMSDVYETVCSENSAEARDVIFGFHKKEKGRTGFRDGEEEAEERKYKEIHSSTMAMTDV